ncbi:MAG: hypothetical protein V1874_06055 [Spirochaetota bacterium]
MKNSETVSKTISIFRPAALIIKRAKLILCVLFMSLGIISGFAQPASALDYIVGAKGGYFIWDPYLKDIGVSEFEEMKNGDGVLYGPVLSVMFSQDFSFSLSGLYGKQSSHWMEEDAPYSGGSEYRTGHHSFNVKRLDLDGALSYRITDNFKIFAGYKYQYLRITIENVSFRRFNGSSRLISIVGKNKIKMPYNGPALGLGLSAPVGERFFFASNLSFLYMWGKMDMDSDSYSYDSNDLTPTKHDNGNNEKFNLRTRGINFEPSIGASMGEGLPIFTVGLRFQWTQVRFLNPAAGSDLNDKWNNDYLYGVFVSVLQPF